MKRRQIQFFLFYILFLLFISSKTAVFASDPTDVQAIKGTIDLSEMDESQMASLNGEWEFYWMELLEPKDIPTQNHKLDYVKVPSIWKNHRAENKLQNSTGYGTYRLTMHIKPQDIGKEKVLFIDGIGSAYKVWIDGIEKEGRGQVGKNELEEIPEIQLNFLYFTPQKETVEIVFQVSNFSYRKGGIFGDIFYGNPKKIQKSVLMDEINSFIVIGGLISIGIYNLLIYLFAKKQRDLLFVGLSSFAIAIRAMFLNKYLAIFITSHIPWFFSKKAEYLIELSIFLFLVLMIRHLYQQEIHPKMVKIAYFYVVGCALFFIFTPPIIFTSILIIHIFILILFISYFIFYVCTKAFLKKREGAKITLIGLVLLLLGMIHDTFQTMEWIDSFKILDICILVFFMLQGGVIAYRFSELKRRNDVLNIQLLELNGQLEETVAIRTQELKEKNAQLETANKKLAALCSTDELTGLANRRQLDKMLKFEVAKAANGQYPLAVMIIDVDYFKNYNDTYGHLLGDHCLKLIGAVLKSHSNGQDIIAARYGGEEFVLILRNTTVEIARMLAENIRQSVENLQQKHSSSPYEIVTISIGISIGIPSVDIPAEQFLDVADHALYQVKEQGRNAVVLFSMQMTDQKRSPRN